MHIRKDAKKEIFWKIQTQLVFVLNTKMKNSANKNHRSTVRGQFIFFFYYTLCAMVFQLILYVIILSVFLLSVFIERYSYCFSLIILFIKRN